MSERDIHDIPLSQLELSPGNVRKTPADASAFTELKASITAHGLLENLIARAMEPGPDGVTRYAVIAGGRRLAAMQALAAEGALDEDHPVPCRMIGGIVAAEEVSLAENSVRAAMHPADQVEAFRRLADAGSTAAAIAARFGVSERTVEKRLRLGNAAPVLLEAYRADEIDLETLMAFAVTTDHARQNAVWETVSQQGYRPGAWQIKRLLTEDRVSATSAIARFVGIEAYEAAGGRIDRDLFAEEDERGIWFDDPDLVNKLAIDSLQVAARELETRWKWAQARLDVDWSATAAFGRVRPQPAEPTDQEKAEIERLRTRNDELANMADKDWTEELVEEADANETRLVAKVEWHPGELYPRVGFIVTNLSRRAERVVAFYNQRGTAEQHIKEGKNAIKWTRLSCRRFDHNAVRLQLHALAYNLGNFMRTLALPDAVEQWSLTSLREKLIKIGERRSCATGATSRSR